MTTYQEHVEHMKSDPLDYVLNIASQEPVHVDIKEPCNFVRGCKNYIWYKTIPTGDTYDFLFASGSAISLGMCLILGSYLTGKTADEILKIKFSDLSEYTRHLPGERQKGVQAVLNRIHKDMKLIDTKQK